MRLHFQQSLPTAHLLTVKKEMKVLLEEARRRKLDSAAFGYLIF